MSLLTPEMEQRLAQVHGQILPEQGLVLAELAAEVRGDKIIVEVGAYKGKSSCYLAAGAKAGRGALVYSIDLWELAPWPEYADPEVHIAWRDNVGHLGLAGQAVPVQSDATEAAQEITSGIGLLFVDGDHSFEYACRDIETWAPRVDADGAMVFHDGDTDEWGVARAIREKLLATGKYRQEMRIGLSIVRREP